MYVSRYFVFRYFVLVCVWIMCVCDSVFCVGGVSLCACLCACAYVCVCFGPELRRLVLRVGYFALLCCALLTVRGYMVNAISHDYLI